MLLLSWGCCCVCHGRGLLLLEHFSKQYSTENHTICCHDPLKEVQSSYHVHNTYQAVKIRKIVIQVRGAQKSYHFYVPYVWEMFHQHSHHIRTSRFCDISFIPFRSALDQTMSKENSLQVRIEQLNACLTLIYFAMLEITISIRDS